jgi:hypothetical protein
MAAAEEMLKPQRKPECQRPAKDDGRHGRCREGMDLAIAHCCGEGARLGAGEGREKQGRGQGRCLDGEESTAHPLAPTGTHWLPLAPTGTHRHPPAPTGTYPHPRWGGPGG